MRSIGFLALAASTAASAQTTLINFDTDASGIPIQPPALFQQTTALRDFYSELGVNFGGPNPLDGGGIVDRVAGNWQLPERSGVGILAFNSDGTYSNGGHPIGPEDIFFDQSMTTVSIWVATNSGGSCSLTAYNAADQLVDTMSLGGMNTWQQLSVSGAGIRRVVLNGTMESFAADDLSFTIPGMSTSAALIFGALAHARRRAD